MDQDAGLFTDGAHHRRMTMTEVVDRHSGEKIEITLAVVIDQPAAFAPRRYQRVTPVSAGNRGQPLFNPLC